MAIDTDVRPQRTIRLLLPIGLVCLAVGLSVAFVSPFLSLFLSTEVHAGPVHVAVFLVIAPLSTVLGSTLIARLSDRRDIRRGLLISAAVAGCVGSAATAVVRDYWVLLGLNVTAMTLAGALFPQTFAYAREVLQRGGSNRSSMALSTLRMVFSVAWVAGPPVSTLLYAAGGFRLVYGSSAAMYAVAAVVAACFLRDVGQRPDGVTAPEADPADQSAPVTPSLPEADASRSAVWLAVIGFVLLQSSGALGVQAMSLFVTRDLDGDVRNVGLILGFCAAVEIPLMLGFGWLSTRLPLRRLILVGAAFGATYFAVASTVTSSVQLGAAQVLNACFIAAVAGLGISYLQDLLPQQPGRAATLFSNSYLIAAMLAGPMLGVAQQFGYRLAYAMGTALCLAGLTLLLIGRPPHVPASAKS